MTQNVPDPGHACERKHRWFAVPVELSMVPLHLEYKIQVISNFSIIRKKSYENILFAVEIQSKTSEVDFIWFLNRLSLLKRIIFIEYSWFSWNWMFNLNLKWWRSNWTGSLKLFWFLHKSQNAVRNAILTPKRIQFF